MANRLSDMTSLTVERKAGHVVLTMTPQRAQLVAASIWLGDADHTEWLDSLADLLRSAAEGGASTMAARNQEQPRNQLTAAGRSDAQPRSADEPSGSNGSLVGGPPVRSDMRAAAAIAEALALTAEAELTAAADLEALAVVAANVTKAAVVAAAAKTMEAADAARAAQSAAAVKMALATAETVRQAAHLVQRHADEDAERVAGAAEEAAVLVALAVMPGTEAVNAEKAAFLATTIHAAAVAKAEETAVAAATVARAAATAAADAAASAADAAMALELQVADTAAAVQAVATATARRVAADHITAADLVLTNG